MNKIIEFELASDLKELIEYNKDIKFETNDIITTIKNAEDDALLMVTKSINSPITFHKVEVVDSEFITEYIK